MSAVTPLHARAGKPARIALLGTGTVGTLVASGGGGDFPSVSEIATAVWTLADGIEPGETPQQTMRIQRAVLAGKAVVSTEKGRNLIAIAPEQIASPATTGKWEKALYDLANNQDGASRDAKSERFMSGIRKFAEFLVEAARAADAQVAFEKTEYKKKPAARRGTARKAPSTK